MPELVEMVDPDAVRAALLPTLEEEELPDDVINKSIYAGRAASYILSRDAGAAEREGAELQHIKNALNLYTASLIAPFMATKTREQIDNFAVSMDKIDWTARAKELSRSTEEELSYVLGTATTTAPPMPTFLVVS
jgi:hypothetical protein